MLDQMSRQYESKLTMLKEAYRRAPNMFFGHQLRIRTKDMKLVPFFPHKIQMKILSYVVYCLKKGIPIRIIILKA